jgi:hypothetical protein
MPIPESIDQDKLAEAALAILSLGTWSDGPVTRAWKGVDWDVMELLHQRGWIGDPVGKQKSVILTEQGISAAESFMEKHFEK